MNLQFRVTQNTGCFGWIITDEPEPDEPVPSVTSQNFAALDEVLNPEDGEPKATAAQRMFLLSYIVGGR